MVYKIYSIKNLTSHTKPCKNAYQTGMSYQNEYPTWAIEINSLENLQELINEVGTIVLYRNLDLKCYIIEIDEYHRGF